MVSYQCETSYELVGQQTMSCLHSGRWSAPAPACLARHCPRLEVQHGEVWGEGGGAPGHALTVSCHRGFVVRGPNRLICQPWLEWSPPPPVCQPLSCDQPPSVQHAISQAQGFSYLDTANYSCVPGYEIRVGRIVLFLITESVVRVTAY